MIQQLRILSVACATLVGAAFFCLTISGAAKAATISHTGFFSDIFDGDFYTSPGALPVGFIFAEEIITGVDKFDPALGTLTGVTVSAEFEAFYDFTVSADDVLDDSLPHTVDVDADFLSSFIGYSPGGGTSTFTLMSADFSPFASCGGGPFEGPCFDGDSDFDLIIDSTDVTTSSGYDASDFVGVGPVTALSAIIAIPSDALFTLDNVGTASADLTAEMIYFDLTVDYEYTPIPEPTTMLLAVVGLVTMSRRRLR